MNQAIRRMPAWLLVGVLAAGLAGCASTTIGKPFPANNVAQLQLGVSTTEDARRLLGEPYQEVTNRAGEQLLVWQYIRSDATSGFASVDVQTSQQGAALVFSPAGRLLRAEKLINAPAPAGRPVTESAAAYPASQSIQEQLGELDRKQLPYEEYQRRYRAIVGPQP